MNDRNPPRFALRFLRWFCPEKLYEGIEGDLLEQFEYDLTQRGTSAARRRFGWNVIRFFRPGIIFRNAFVFHLMNTTLLRNYFKVSYRHLAKNKTFAIVNIVGLALGMAAALLIYDYTRFEKSFDTFHANANNLYRVTTAWNPRSTPDDVRATSVPWSGPGVKEAFPEVMEYTRFAPLHAMSGDKTIYYNEAQIEEANTFLADPGFLKMFSFEMLEGNKETALNEPGNIVITQSVADKYFKDESPLGKILLMNAENLTENNFKITGVIQDPPANSHMKFDFLVSYKAIPSMLANGSTYWHWDFTYCYLLLRPDADVSALERKISELRVNLFGKEFRDYNDDVTFKLQPVKDIHLYSGLRGELGLNGDGRSVEFLIIVGICILMSAYINYVNLSTIKAVERRKEIGVRRVVGSTKRQLMLQLIVESVVINLIAFLLAVIIASGSAPLIESTFAIQWPQFELGLPSVEFIGYIGMILATGIFVSALYPAFVMTSFKPSEVLKGSKTSGMHAGKMTLRKFLIVMQFVFCIGFITGTFVLYKQLQFMKSHDLGMNMEQVVVVKGYGFQKYKVYKNFKDQLSSNAQVSSVGYSTVAPGDEVILLGLKPNVTITGKTESEQITMAHVDDGFFETLDIKFIGGRAFSNSIKTDEDAVVVNEAAARLFGYQNPQEIVSESLDGLQQNPVKIIGVIKDYHQRSLKNELEPMVFVPVWKDDYGWTKKYYFVKIKGDQGFAPALKDIAKAWKVASPENPFSYTFLDSRFDHQYKSDTTFGSLFLFFSGFAIFIACLGLFGLVAYITLQRTKEIGIRKVLGASVRNILALISGDFAKLIIVASCIAVPLSWYGLRQWLEQYAFRINLDIILFVYPVVSIFLLAIVTIVWKSFKVALADPVDSIRYE
jgi:putative ABC transport system permease protein